jgi:hypothetical protein
MWMRIAPTTEFAEPIRNVLVGHLTWPSTETQLLLAGIRFHKKESLQSLLAAEEPFAECPTRYLAAADRARLRGVGGARGAPLWRGARHRENGDRQQGSTKVNFKGICRASPLSPSRPPLAPTRGSHGWTCGAGFFSFRPLNMCGGVPRCRTRYPLGRSRWMERTTCPIVVSVLCKSAAEIASRGDVSENQSRCCLDQKFS